MKTLLLLDSGLCFIFSDLQLSMLNLSYASLLRLGLGLLICSHAFKLDVFVPTGEKLSFFQTFISIKKKKNRSCSFVPGDVVISAVGLSKSIVLFFTVLSCSLEQNNTGLLARAVLIGFTLKHNRGLKEATLLFWVNIFRIQMSAGETGARWGNRPVQHCIVG